MRPPLHALQIPDAEFVVCDVETTGLSPDHNRMTEIALVRVAEGRVVEKYQTLINPRQFIPPFITELTGITNEMVYSAPDADEVLPAIRAFIGDAVFVGHNARFDFSFVDAALRRAGLAPLENAVLCTARLARRLVPALAKKNLGSIARHLGISNPRAHRASGDAETTARILLHFAGMVSEEHDVADLGDLLSFQNKPVYRVTTPPKNFLKLQPALAALPHEPGIYFFHDARGHIIYIGKARDLSDRVHSYFRYNVGHSEKVLKLARAVASITWKTTDTELSALLAEARAIRQHQPRFNALLKSARAYPFIRIDCADTFPTISWTYDMEDDGADYYGPFSSRFAVERALEVIDRIFLIRECDGRITPRDTATPCLYYDIKRCGAPCASLQSAEEYAEEVQRVRQFLRGRHDSVLNGLRAAMESRAEALDFEGAASVRDRLRDLERIVRQQRVMARSVRYQNLVIVTLARRTFVEVHCMKSGMLVAQELLDQRACTRQNVRTLLSESFFSGQNELFLGGKEDIAEMRIIASWCLTRRDESVVIEADDHQTRDALIDAVYAAVRGLGRDEAPARFAERA
ncbi:MAG: DEDD exonuclease domain-containing protein [Ignavibacteriae bacterium]|nr:DEDD exonuclease domain-containing protein [Ignavibacteriota bacterium]